MDRKDFKIFVEGIDPIYYDFYDEGFNCVDEKEEADVTVRRNGYLYDSFWAWSTPKYTPTSREETILRVINLFHMKYCADINEPFVGIRNAGSTETEEFVQSAMSDLKAAGIECREIRTVVPWGCVIIVEVHGENSDVYEAKKEFSEHGFMHVHNTLARVEKLLPRFSSFNKDFI